jgi:hypothetical protein
MTATNGGAVTPAGISGKMCPQGMIFRPRSGRFSGDSRLRTNRSVKSGNFCPNARPRGWHAP